MKVPCSESDLPNHHCPVEPSETAVLEMRKVCGAM